MHDRITLGLLAGVGLLLAALAFGLPNIAFGDASTTLTGEQAIRLKAQARHRLDFPPIKMQVEEGSAASDDPDAGHGKVAIRSLFGFRTGSVTLDANGGESVSRSKWEIALWAGFIVIELAIIVLFVAIWQTGGDYYADDEDASLEPVREPRAGDPPSDI